MVLSAIQEPEWPAIQLDPARRFRIGVLRGEFAHELDPDVGALFSGAVERLTDLGHDLRDVDLGVDLAESDDHGNAFGTDFIDTYDIELAAHPDLLGLELRGWVEAYRAADPATYAEALRYQAWVTDHVATAMRRVGSADLSHGESPGGAAGDRGG
jgi:Asp-tRNA(Asn)/Glu-tRNA(Gln) amidotransferase A subunit family amidase